MPHETIADLTKKNMPQCPTRSGLSANGKKIFWNYYCWPTNEENMIDLYLDRGELFALYDGGLKASAW